MDTLCHCVCFFNSILCVCVECVLLLCVILYDCFVTVWNTEIKRNEIRKQNCTTKKLFTIRKHFSFFVLLLLLPVCIQLCSFIEWLLFDFLIWPRSFSVTEAQILFNVVRFWVCDKMKSTAMCRWERTGVCYFVLFSAFYDIHEK